MPLRFFRRVRIAPGVSINLSKSGASVSVGPKGAKVTVGPTGVRRTVGLPGSGLYYTTSSPLATASTPRDATTDPATSQRAGSGGLWGRRSRAGKALIVTGTLVVLAALTSNGRASGPAAPSGASLGLPAPGATSIAVVATTAPTGRETPAPSAATPNPTTAPVVAMVTIPQPKATPRPAAKPTAAKCHPSYSPCLPIVGDLDCPEVRAMGKAPVRVIGPDSYRLDRDKDGIGCE